MTIAVAFASLLIVVGSGHRVFAQSSGETIQSVSPKVV